MSRRKKGLLAAVYAALFTMIFLTACAVQGENGSSKKENSPGAETEPDTGYIVTGPESYDSFDTPLVVRTDETGHTITFLNFDTGKYYTLNIDGVSKFYDKYGKVLSFAQVAPGDLVDVLFLKDTKHLVKLNLSASAWEYENIEKYSIDDRRKEVSVGNEIFKLSKDAVFFSNGRRIDRMELSDGDVLTFEGIGSTVLCVKVEKGHGYLRLTNAENFVGGWIELGSKQIRKITSDMLITAPEGSYQVHISYKGNGGTKNVVINRDEETTLDIGDFKVTEVQRGKVGFVLKPETAKLYIDGTETDVSVPAVLEFGIHQVTVKAEGYQTLTQYLRVGEDSADVEIEMEPIRQTVSGNDTEKQTQTAAEESFKISVDSPTGAEVYVDGNYVGMSPVSFKKTAGTHVIILRKNGYETRSYTIQVDEEKRDISYSFAEMEEKTESHSEE